MKILLKPITLVTGLLVWTGHATAEHEQLPSLIIEGSATRAGTFATAPDNTGLKDTASLLERVPGANVNRNGVLTGIAAYRGMFGNRVTTTIDSSALKEAGPNSMDPPLSHYPAALTESLTVHRGIAPVSSGIETMGGSMHAKSRKGQFAEGEGIETHGVGSMGYSSVDDGHVGALMGSVANKNHKLHLSGSQEKGGDYTHRGGREQANTQYDRNAFSGGYGYQRDGHEFSLNYSNTDQGVTGTPALPMDINYVRGGMWDMHHDWEMDNGMTLKTDVFYQKMRHLMSNNVLRSPATAMTNRTKVEAGGISMALAMPFNGGELIVGVDGDQANHDANSTMGSMGMMNTNFFNKVERDRYSIFTEWTGALSEDISVELGTRYTHVWSDAGDVSTGPMSMAMKQANATAFNARERTKTYSMVDVVAELQYQASSELDVNVGIARKNRAPTYQELYIWHGSKANAGFADGKTYMGNLGLDVETAYQADFSLDWHTADAYITPSAFYHYVENYIMGTAAGSGMSADLKWDNTDAQFFGAELEAGYRFTDNLRTDASVNYVRGMRVSDLNGDDDLYRIAPLNGRLQLTYEQSNWSTSMEGVFVADQGDVAGYNDEQSTKGYMQLNLRAQYEPYQGLVIATGMENVLDEQRYNHLGGYQNHDVTAQRNFLPGRNMYATLGYSW